MVTGEREEIMTDIRTHTHTYNTHTHTDEQTSTIYKRRQLFEKNNYWHMT